MKRDARRALLLLTAVIPILLPAGQTYAGKNNNDLESSNKCSKRCSKNANYMVRVECYTRCIEDNPDNARLYYLRGETYRKVFLFNSAISDFIKVVELEPENIDMYYTIASTAALAYNKEYALLWLQKALEAGFNDVQRIASDPSLNNIRNSREFKDLMDKWDYEFSSLK